MALIETARDGHVATVRLARPEALNAISGEMAEDLAAAFRGAAADRDVWAVILAAAGDRAFCAGADLKERNAFADEDWARNRGQIRGMFDALRAVPQPVVGAAFGYALGGGFELLLACDLVVAAEDAVFGLPETGVGIVPGGGGTQALARLAGPGVAKQMILAGRRLGAEEARALGLVARIVPPGELEAVAREVAEGLCRLSPVASREAKRAIDEGLGRPLADGLELEDAAWRAAVASRDRREGVAAFVERREPRWENR